ncbi:MAG: LacI family transcriptional regulator [Opitutaceae bacterium]|nr:LacI family transcriptional regulator [Opitutaceae bacterium]
MTGSGRVFEATTDSIPAVMDDEHRRDAGSGADARDQAGFAGKMDTVCCRRGSTLVSGSGFRYHADMVWSLPPPRMNIRELARIAGVAHTTVSRALRNHPSLPRETCIRIQKLATRHGYAPHPVVSQLMTQLPRVRRLPRPVLAAITCWPDWRRRSPFNSLIYQGMEKRAAQLGYRMEEFSLLDEDMTAPRLSSILYARRIEGVIVCPFKQGPVRLDLKWEYFAGVAIGHSVVSPALHRISPGYYENMLLALRELKRLGYRRIALALTPAIRVRTDDAYVAAYGLYERDLPARERIPVFCSARASEVKPRRRPLHADESLDMHSWLDPVAVASWLRQHRADVLICNSSPAPAALRRAGLQIPGEMAYLSLDNTIFREEISGIDLMPEQMGAAAIDMVTAHLHRRECGLPDTPKIMSLQSRWRAGVTAIARELTARES